MSAEKKQSGGSHYKKMAIQPMRFSMENGLDACQHTAIKYIARFRDKGGIDDLEKAKHTIDLLIMFELERQSALKPDAPNEDSFKTVCDNVDEFNEFKPCEYTLQEVIGDAVLSDWAEWVAVDDDGRVDEYENKPHTLETIWDITSSESKHRNINKVVPPLNFKNCLFKVKK